MKPGHYFGCLGHQGEIALGPRSAESYRLGRLAVEVAHFRRQRFLALVKGSWQGRAKDSEIFLRGINRHARVHPQQVIQAAGVIAMAMGDYDEIELGELDP